MGCSIKMIVKFGLIAEIITAIIGSIGEYSLRYHIYTSAMNELFGPYFDDTIQDINSDGAGSLRNHDYHHQHEEWLSNHLHYDHLTGKSFQSSDLNRFGDNFGQPEFRPTTSKVGNERSFPAKLFSRISSWLFPGGNNHQTKDLNSQLVDNLTHRNQSHLDPRPLLVLSILIILNIVFIFVVTMEYLSLIGLMAILWILYLIMMFVIVRVMNDSTAKQLLQQPQDNLGQLHQPTAKFTQWSTLLPSPFIILVVIIILLFSFILIALITEERKQIAARIRARSACIPLVKSRDMDLDI